MDFFKYENKTLLIFERVGQVSVTCTALILNFIYSPFEPIDSDISSEKEQKKLHETMEDVIDKLYMKQSCLGYQIYIQSTPNHPAPTHSERCGV